MHVKIFLLGSPGSGKSTACRTITDHILQRGSIKHVSRINDYDILREMFLAEPVPVRFQATEEYGGFDVLDLTVCDEALRIANEKMKLWVASAKEAWMLVEFSRNDYEGAFQQFDPSFLRDICVLFVEADGQLCRDRVRERVKSPRSSDDHYVSDYIFKTYYNTVDTPNIREICGKYGVDRVEILTNNGSLEEFLEKVRLFADTILQPV